jgi:hypothetical protein
MFGGMDDLGAKLARQIKELKLDVKLLAGDGVCNDRIALSKLRPKPPMY